jgi:hypothetical protein
MSGIEQVRREVDFACSSLEKGLHHTSEADNQREQLASMLGALVSTLRGMPFGDMQRVRLGLVESQTMAAYTIDQGTRLLMASAQGSGPDSLLTTAANAAKRAHTAQNKASLYGELGNDLQRLFASVDQLHDQADAIIERLKLVGEQNITIEGAISEAADSAALYIQTDS